MITSFAGNHFVADTRDGGPATSAQMAFIFGITLDPSGNLFIADANDFLMRKVDTSGVITTIAGTGQNGSAGDGGPALQATLNPDALISDASGNLFFVDLANRIRKIDTSGNITTVAGNGRVGFSGDNGPATSAELGGPFISMAMDSSGNLLIGDEGNNRIRKVDGSGIITTVAGNGTAGFSGDNGPAINAEFNLISAIAFDGAGNLFVADQANNRIRKIDTLGIVTTVAGNGAPGFSGDGGPATAAQINPGNALALDSRGNLFIGEDQRVRRVDSTGTITTVAGNGPGLFSGDGGPAVSAGIAGPIFGLAADGHGNLLISDPLTGACARSLMPAASRSSTYPPLLALSCLLVEALPMSL